MIDIKKTEKCIRTENNYSFFNSFLERDLDKLFFQLKYDHVIFFVKKT